MKRNYSSIGGSSLDQHARLTVSVTVGLRLDDHSMSSVSVPNLARASSKTQQLQQQQSARTQLSSRMLSSRLTSPKFSPPSRLQSATERGVPTEGSPSPTVRSVTGLKATVGSTIPTEADPFITHCQTSLSVGPQDRLIGLILRKRNGLLERPSKIDIAPPSPEFDIAMTDSKWMYVICVSGKKLHVCAVDVDAMFYMALHLIASNLRRLKQEAKIAQHWPACNISVTFSEFHIPSLYFWVCTDHRPFDQMSLRTTASTLPRPNAFCAVDVGKPQEGLIRQDLTFSISAVKSFLAYQVNLKGSYISVKKFLNGYVKHLKRKEIESVPVFQKINVRTWVANADKDRTSDRQAVMLPKYRRRIKDTLLLSQFNFENLELLITSHQKPDAVHIRPDTFLLSKVISDMVY